MRKLFKVKPRTDALLAVCPDNRGIALASVARRGGSHPALEHCEYLSFSSAGEQADALGVIARRREFERLRCVTSISGNSYSLLLLDAPDVPASELRAAMRWRVKDVIDFPVEEAVIDVFSAPPDKSGRSDRIYAVVARVDAVRARVDRLLDAGFELTAVDIPEFLLRNIASLLPENRSGVALLHFADDHGLIALTREDTLYLSRRFEPGAADLFGSTGELTPALEGRLDSVVIEIQRSLDYYESHFAQPSIGTIAVAPLAKPVPGVVEYLASQLGLRVRMLDLNEVLTLPQPLDAATQSRCFHAVGAALRQEEMAA